MVVTTVNSSHDLCQLGSIKRPFINLPLHSQSIPSCFPSFSPSGLSSFLPSLGPTCCLFVLTVYLRVCLLPKSQGAMLCTLVACESIMTAWTCPLLFSSLPLHPLLPLPACCALAGVNRPYTWSSFMCLDAHLHTTVQHSTSASAGNSHIGEVHHFV